MIEEGLGGEGVASVCQRYLQNAITLREERLNRAIVTIRQLQSQGKLGYLGDDPGQLRDAAEHMTQGEVNEEHPEGAGEWEEWLELLSWLDPGEAELALWGRICEINEREISQENPFRFLPRLRFCEWLQRYEGYNIMAEHLTHIWQEGDLKHWAVRQSGRLLFRLMGAQAPVEETAGVGEQIIREFRDALGERHPDLHLMMHEVAGYLAEKQQISAAANLYDELIRMVSSNLEEDHPYMQKLKAERNKLSQ